ncbi:hypothetical protein GCM10010387_63010 [Streptomyces inusitatus]|uniref:Uncharacterized protein n=1 Tax=Streptomyces inusitatus TaxID=68221 RepID=A0A918QMZ4_9ACTN|nr:hypothetical protein [Streptomyces inusitatus]GGZ60728.1 hypothetical protein GCM10010387_63010 [Streptomyces inusitatus]
MFHRITTVRARSSDAVPRHRTAWYPAVTLATAVCATGVCATAMTGTAGAIIGVMATSHTGDGTGNHEEDRG